MRRTKANRALTFVMAAALLIGSIHGVGAKEQSKAYDAPELTLTQSVTDYDLTEGITYDSEKYTLSVTDTGNFDINVAGDYEISYALTEKESSVNEIENVENAESAGITESTGTASDAETIETTDTTATVEDTDQTLEGDDTNTGDTQAKQVITFTRTVHVAAASEDEVPVYVARELVLVQGEEDYDLTDEIVYDDVNYTLDVVELGGFDISKVGSYEVTYSLTPVTTEGTQENGQNDIQENQVITFQRTVTVKAAEEENALYEAPELELKIPAEDYDGQVSTLSFFDGSTTTQGIFVTELGTPLWLDETKNQFTFPHATVTTQEVNKKVTNISIYVNTANVTIESTATMVDNNKTFATWIFRDNGGLTAEEAQSKLREIIFKDQRADKTTGIDIRIDVDGNETSANMTGNQLTYYPDNGHYYMYINGNIPWTDAYNNAKSYTFQGMKGYLATVMTQDEMIVLRRIVSSGGGYDHLGGARYSGINDADSLNGLSYSPIWPSGYYASGYYWVCGPEGKPQTNIPWSLWRPGEPNIGEGSGTWEYNVCIIKNDIKLNDIANNTGYPKGYYVEFGGYAEGQDPGGRNDGYVSHIVFKDQVHAAEAKIGTDKYYPLCAAIDIAKDGETVEIISDTVTAGEGVLAKGAMLKTMDGKTYKSNTDSDIAVDTDSNVTLKDGVLEVSSSTTLKVLNNVDNQIYTVTTPGCTSVVSTSKDGDSPNIRGANDGIIKIGNAGEEIAYTYKNPNSTTEAVVYIPDAMADNGQVTKAELSADKVVGIQVDNRQTVLMKGTGSTSDTVSVERRSRDQKLDLNLPAGASATAFGHEIGAAPVHGVKVSQASTNNVSYPNRDYITLTSIGDSITVDNVNYTASDADQKLYLGTFQVDMTIGNHAKVKGSTPALPHYLEEYTITICPDTGYDLDKDNFVLTMKENDTADAKNLAFATYCTEEADGSIKVTIPKVTGDITIHAEAKKQTSKLTINGLDGRGTVKVLDGEGQVHELKQGNDSVTVNRNEELTLIFTPNDFSNPYYSDLTGEKGESFSILTALQDTTNNTDLFTGAKTFNWKEKSYELKYTPTTSDVTLQAVFTPSHIVHVHVTGGTAEVKDTGLVTKESGADQFQHVIVKDNETVKLELKDTTGTATVYKKAYWSNVDGSDDRDVSIQAFTGNGPSYTYTTRAVGKPRALNITFEEGQTVDVKVTHGTLVTGNDGVAWNDKGNSTYQTIVKNNGALKVNIKPEDGYGLKSITVNNVAIDIDAAIKSGEITWDGTTKTYSHTFAKVYQAWNVTVDFEKLHEIVFQDQKGNILNKTERITVIDGDTIPAASFTKMQEEADKLKAENESLFVWVDKTDSTKIYNETTVMTAQTADVVTLIPVYRMNVIKGADGSVIAADDFVIHVNDVRKLTDTEAATFANVTAYDHSGSDISNMVTVEQTKLEELKKKTKGTYVDALTFMIAASGLTTGVDVEVTDDNPTITGKTAYTLTFKGRANETYKYQELDAQGTPTGNVSTILTDGDGKATITGLKKATPYQISHKKYGSVNGKTALVDAKDIAKQFEDRGAGDTTGNNATDKTEKAENSNVQVVVDADGNYKVIVKKDIDHTVEIPDTWGEVKIDLNDKTITGDKADDNNEAKPGLEFVKDANSNEHPGTNLEIVNGTIKGGDGSAKHPDGAAGIGASGDTADAGIIIGNNANVTGGNGANGTEGTDGGNGGAGIDGNGKLTPTVSGTVTGGNGGKGGDSVAGIPGNGGNGGTGISAGDKTITINPGGTVKGGDAGNGGNATGDNTNPGGNGGNGGTGTETTQPGKTDNNGGTTSGGNGGDGGKSDNGNGGNGGNGGSGSTGESNNNGGTNSGGNGGNGGDSDKGNGGSGGNGGSSGETGGNGGNNTGGNGGNGGDSNNGNGGSGGNGGESNSGTGGNGGNGGDSNNGTGGNGGNGGESNSGNGGNGGNGGESNNGTGGNGGNGGESNSGNGGNGGDGGNGKNPGTGGNGGGSNSGNNGSSGSDGNRPGGNGGNNNGSGGNNGSNNGGNNSGNNGGNSNGNTNGTNTGVTDGKTNATDIAAADGNNASGGNKNNKHNRNNRNNNESDQADGEDVTEGTETDADTGSDDTTDVADSTETGADADGSGNADDSIPADSSDADGHISFADCGSHWYPVILILVIAGYTVLRIRKIREELDGE